MKILITGTAGFTLWNKIEDFNAKHYSTGRIGYHLARRLIERGDTVVGIDNINDYYDINLKPETPVKYAPTVAFHGVNPKPETWNQQPFLPSALCPLPHAPATRNPGEICSHLRISQGKPGT